MATKPNKRWNLDQALGPRSHYYMTTNETAFIYKGEGILCEIVVNKDATDNLIIQDIGGATSTTAILGIINGTSSAMGNYVLTNASTTFTNPTYARPITVMPSGTTNDVAACVVRVYGTDWKGDNIYEDFSFAANASTVTKGVEYFTTVTEAIFPGQDGTGAKFSIGVGEGSMIANITNPRKGDRYRYFIKTNQGLKVYSGTTGDYTITYING